MALTAVNVVCRYIFKANVNFSWSEEVVVALLVLTYMVGAALCSGDYTPSSRVLIHLKDQRNAQELARARGALRQGERLLPRPRRLHPSGTAQRWRTHRRRSLVLIPHGKRCYGYEEPALPLRRSLRFCPKACKIQYENERPPHVGALHSIASFCRYACIGFVMQFFRNHMENNMDESADRPGVLFDTFLTTAVQVAD